MPLHPLVVHFPLVLAVLLPAVVVAVIWSRARRKPLLGSWWLVTGWAALLTLSAVIAVKTGEQDEERVEAVVAESMIEEHEERAELFMWLSAAFFAATIVAPLVRSDRARAAAGVAAAVMSVVLAGFAVAVGHSGGRLVYEANAGSAYSADPATRGRSSETSHRDDDEDDGEDKTHRGT